MTLLTVYNTFLKRFPILGTSISAGGCYILGDFIAQKVEIIFNGTLSSKLF